MILIIPRKSRSSQVFRIRIDIIVKQKNIVILGSTGSIGEQTLEVVREHPDKFNVLALSCNKSCEILGRQVKEFQPDYALICDENKAQEFHSGISGTRPSPAVRRPSSNTEILKGAGHLSELAQLDEADIILNAVVGFAGFESTVKALQSDKIVALANKESLVVGGALIQDILDEGLGSLIPVDSEHSAIFQCLAGEEYKSIEQLIITASGGPFRTWSREQMQSITVEQALNHPNWSMGNKITIDSATMMNKGLEVIEAHWLFGLPLTKIEAVIHPQSIIHSMVTFVDGSSKAQLGPPTMKVPILYALTQPDRINLNTERLNWREALDLNFEPIDHKKFPCFKLALQTIEAAGNAPVILNAANEIAVQRFLNEEISYKQIPELIGACLSSIDEPFHKSVEALKSIDAKTRQMALNFETTSL
jgi:1-deoxy-D-xylulose-5-phosphate reductoisomerase